MAGILTDALHENMLISRFEEMLSKDFQIQGPTAVTYLEDEQSIVPASAQQKLTWFNKPNSSPNPLIQSQTPAFYSNQTLDKGTALMFLELFFSLNLGDFYDPTSPDELRQLIGKLNGAYLSFETSNSGALLLPRIPILKYLYLDGAGAVAVQNDNAGALDTSQVLQGGGYPFAPYKFPNGFFISDQVSMGVVSTMPSSTKYATTPAFTKTYGLRLNIKTAFVQLPQTPRA